MRTLTFQILSHIPVYGNLFRLRHGVPTTSVFWEELYRQGIAEEVKRLTAEYIKIHPKEAITNEVFNKLLRLAQQNVEAARH